jgi:hypothetical protein
MRTSEDRISIGHPSSDVGSPQAAAFHIVAINRGAGSARDEQASAENQSSIDAKFVTEGDARVEKAYSSC